MEIRLIYFVFIVVIVVVCYYKVFDCGFVFDDMLVIVENKDFRFRILVANLFWNDFWGIFMKMVCFKDFLIFCVLCLYRK